MAREKWLFRYSPTYVLEAAQRREEYHTRREAFWRAQFDTMKQELPEAISIVNIEAVMKAASLSNYGTPNLAIDPKLVRRFHQASSKVIEHRDKAEGFHRWIGLLQGVIAAPLQQQALELDFADAMYFGLHEPANAAQRVLEEEESTLDDTE